MVAGKALQKYAMDIEDQQELFMNAADMMIEIYAVEKAVLRAEKLAQANGE